MADFINTIDLLGDEETAQMIIAGTITEYNDDQLDSLPGNAFYAQKALASVKLPNLTSAGEYCFQGCSNLLSAELDKITTLSRGFFSNMQKLDYLYLPKCEVFARDSIYGPTGSNLTLVFPAAKTFQANCFSYLWRAKNIYLPAVPPTCEGSNPFTSVYGPESSNVCIFHVPAGAIPAYQADPVWEPMVTKHTWRDDSPY